MIRIFRGINTCRVEAPEEVHKALDRHFALAVPGAWFSQLFKKHRWDGYAHFYSIARASFPSGLFNRVCAYLNMEDLQYHVYDNRVRPLDAKPLSPIGTELRGYQTAAVDAIQNKQPCIVKAATNAGKTLMAAELVRRLNLPTLYLVNRKELLHQTADRLEEYLGEPVGLVGDDISTVEKITVAMPSTLVKSYKALGGVTKKVRPEYSKLLNSNVLILDECQSLPDKRILNVVRNTKAYYRVAMSGTPLLNSDVDNMTLIGQFGDIGFEITNTEMIDLGFSAKPEVLLFKIDVRNVLGSDYVTAYDKGIVNNKDRNTAIANAAEVCSRAGMSVLVLVKEIQHGLNIHKGLPGSKFVNGELPWATRSKIIDEFKSRKVLSLVSSSIMDVGIDVDAIDVLVLAGGDYSPKLLLQRLGRGLRKRTDKDKLLVIDFVDFGNVHLLTHSQRRYSTLKQEGFTYTVLEDIDDLISRVR